MISAILVLYIAGMVMVRKEDLVLMFSVTLFPMLDTLSDFLNLISITWATNTLFHIAWLTILLPNIILFIYDLWKKRVVPRVFFYSYIQSLFWLKNIGGVPGYFDKPMLKIAFYDDIPKLLLLWTCWVISIAAQCVCAIAAVELLIPSLLFYLVMLLIGVILFASKMIT